MRGLMLVVALAVTSSAFAATPILTDMKAGKFSGTLKSYVSKAIDGKKGELTVAKTGEGTLLTFKVEGAQGNEREEWLLQGDELVQREFDASGKMTRNYTAKITTTKPATAGEATFAIHCQDAAKNVCDGGIDSRNAWTISSNGDSVTYTVWGVEKAEDRNNPKANVIKRHEFSFRTVPSTTTPAATTAPTTGATPAPAANATTKAPAAATTPAAAPAPAKAAPAMPAKK